MVLGREASGDDARVAKLAEVVFFEADRERFYRPRTVAAHEGHDRARVDAATEHRAERYVADHAEANGLVQPRAELVAELLFRGGHLRRVLQGPVLLGAQRA